MSELPAGRRAKRRDAHYIVLALVQESEHAWTDLKCSANPRNQQLMIPLYKNRIVTPEQFLPSFTDSVANKHIPDSPKGILLKHRTVS